MAPNYEISMTGLPAIECASDAALDQQRASRVYEIDPLRDSRWAEFVQRHPKASVFHSLAWLRALQCTYGYEPAVLSLSRPGQPLDTGLVFCRVASWLTGKRIVALPFSDHCDPLFNSAEELDTILVDLKNRTQKENRKYLELRPASPIPGCPSRLQEYQTYLWHSVDLSRNCDELLKTFDKDCVQRRIKRAERESLQYEVGNSEDLLRKFYSLMVMTRRRHGLPPQPLAWFRNLGRCFGDQLQIRLASHGGLPVASIITLKHGNTVTYKYGCSDARLNRYGGMPLLLWRTIEEAKSEGFTQLDLGRARLTDSGLIRFKQNWAARVSVIRYLRFPGQRPSERPRPGASLMRRLVTLAPKWSLVAAGELLYPHIG